MGKRKKKFKDIELNEVKFGEAGLTKFQKAFEKDCIKNGQPFKVIRKRPLPYLY